MQYAQGTIGRVFLLKFEDKDDLLGEMKKLAVVEHIRAATIMLLGGMRSAGIVSGPREPVIPPDPLWVNFNDGREIVGFGTLFRHGEEPVIHLHGAIGRGDETFVGCVRKDSTVFLVVEAMITEITGIDAKKEPDSASGLVMLRLAGGKKP